MLLELIQEKNRCLRRLKKHSQEFLEKIEFEDFDLNLDELEKQRDYVLKAIELYDRKIQEAIQLLNPKDKTQQLIDDVRNETAKTEGLKREIQDLDEKIFHQLDHEKEAVRKQLGGTQREKNLYGKLKGQWVRPTGEGLDEKL